MKTPSLRALAAQVLALPAAGGLLAAQNVQPPPPWVAGDTHEMVQLCPGAGGVIPPDRDLADVHAEMLAKDLNVMDVLVLVTGTTSCWQYAGQYAPRVTGMEEALTLGDPEHLIQYGCEVVGGPDPGCEYPAWGHVVGLGIRDALYPMQADHPGAHLDFFRAQPGALTGYPHVAWPEGTRVPEDFPPIDRNFTRLYPLLAPVDVALGRVDFLATADVGLQATSITTDPWWGLWYKLLNAGRRVSIAGGTVAQCYAALGQLDARTYARLDGGQLDHQGWVEAIRAGRTSIADGSQDFLLLTAGGEQVGGRLELLGAVPKQVPVHVELHTSVPRQTTIEVVHDGLVVASDAVDLPGPGVHVFDVLVPVMQSGWLAARTLPKAHTGAVSLIVNRRPITDPATGDYFAAFARHVLDFLDRAQELCIACGGACGACAESEAWLGASEPQIRAELALGAATYQALAGYERPVPGVSRRYGVSTASCLGPIGIGLQDAPVPGESVTVTAFNAPPGSTAMLAVGRQPELPPKTYNGALRYVKTGPALQTFLGTVSDGGYVEIDVPVGINTQSILAYAQFFFLNPPDCPGPAAMSASDALEVEIPPGLFRGQ